MKRIGLALLVMAIFCAGYFNYQKKTAHTPRYTRKISSAKMTPYQKEMEKLLYSTFEPDQTYADLLLKNANTLDYPIVYKREQHLPCDCRERIYQEFQDSLMQQPLSVKVRYIYNDDQQLLESTHLNDGQLTSKLSYTRDDHGLIQKIRTINQYGKFLTWFIYEKDRFHKVTLQDDVPAAYETFFLSDLKQVIRRSAIQTELIPAISHSFNYDQLGRLTKETTREAELIYEYPNDEEDVYSKFSYYRLNPRKLISINEITWDNNRQILVGKTANLQPSFRHIKEKTDNCTLRSYVYNENERLMSSTLDSCK